MKWNTVKIGGVGFVSGIITGHKEMFLRTDVGGAYKWNYETSHGCAYFSDAITVIFKTTDDGKTFTQTDVTEHIQVHGNGDDRECIEPIAVDPDNQSIIYAEGDGNNTATGYYTIDNGKIWKNMKCSPGGKASVTKLDNGNYRFLKSGKERGSVSYSDDFGATWKNEVLRGLRILFVITICAMLQVILHLLWKILLQWLNGGRVCLYIITGKGTKSKKTNVFYCKTVGY